MQNFDAASLLSLPANLPPLLFITTGTLQDAFDLRRAVPHRGGVRPRIRVSQSRIAQDLGLSQGLVSRVLNGDRRHISAETYDRVWQHALALGYRGKGLNVQATVKAAQVHQVGLILRAGMPLTTHSNYFSHVQAGLQGVLASQRIGLVLLGSEDTLDFSAPPQLPGRVVIFGDPQAAFVRKLRRYVTRIVAVGGSAHGYCHTVAANESRALDLLVEHLKELGHRRLGWIGGEPAYARHQERFAAFQQALEAHGLPAPAAADIVITENGARQMDGRAAIMKLLGRRSRAKLPTAVVAYNGTMARGAISALLQHGWKIPEELSVAAVDLTRVTTDDDPTITGASAAPEKMGEDAARLLLMDQAASDEENLLHVEVAAKLRVGASTAAPRR